MKLTPCINFTDPLEQSKIAPACSARSFFLNIFFWCAPFGYLYCSVGWDKIRTHDLLIVNLFCIPLDQAFACARSLAHLVSLHPASPLNTIRNYDQMKSTGAKAACHCMMIKLTRGLTLLWHHTISFLALL